MKITHIFLVLFLLLGLSSCSTNDDVLDTKHETLATDPPLEEAGEEEEIEPNN